jgi:hypothetical protein
MRGSVVSRAEAGGFDHVSPIAVDVSVGGRIFRERRLAAAHLPGQFWETFRKLATLSPNPLSSGREGEFRGSEIPFDTG